MASTEDSGCGHGSQGSPQTSLEEHKYPNKATENDNANKNETPPKYEPSPKHEPKHGWGSKNPIKSKKEGQKLLDSGIKDGKQVYNITKDGTIVKFQPAGTSDNAYHAYAVSKPRDIPPRVLKEMYKQGMISKSEYNKYRKGKK